MKTTELPDQPQTVLSAVRPTTLPQWAESQRAFPVPLAHARIFCVGRSTERPFLDRPIATATFDKTVAQMHFKGTELRIDDAEVYREIIHLARGMTADRNSPVVITFKAYSMLRALRWQPSSIYYNQLRLCLDRLQGAQIKYQTTTTAKQTRHGGFFASFLASVKYVGLPENSDYEVTLDKSVAGLFKDFLTIEHDVYKLLTKPVARWLHPLLTFQLNSGGKVQADIDELRELSGSTAGELRTWKSTLKVALNELQTHGIIGHFTIVGTVLRISRASEKIEELQFPVLAMPQLDSTQRSLMF